MCCLCGVQCGICKEKKHGEPMIQRQQQYVMAEYSDLGSVITYCYARGIPGWGKKKKKRNKK